MPEVIARVSRVVAQLSYGERRIEYDFPGDVLYRVHVPDEFAEQSDDKVVFNQDGIRYLLKDLSVVLYLDVDKSDF